MKTAKKKKWLIISIAATAAILVLVFAILIPFVNSQKEYALSKVEWTVRDIFVYPSQVDEDDIGRLKTELAEITGETWLEEEFKKQALEAIEDHDWNMTLLSTDFHDFKCQQIVLEKLDYECAEFKDAYQETLMKAFRNFESLGFSELAGDVLEGPLGEQEIYNSKLSYYNDPKTIFLNDYIPGYFRENGQAALSTGDTGKLLSLCDGLAAVSAHADVGQLANVDEILKTLTTDAEEITVKEGTGYYGDKSFEADSDYENDAIWDQYLPGDYIHSKFKSVKYYGDLASIYFETSGVYKDASGKIHSDTRETNYSTQVLLKGERISYGSVETPYVKYACEDGMVSYHKDGYCFAVSDSALTCFVGGEFLFEFGK